VYTSITWPSSVPAIVSSTCDRPEAEDQRAHAAQLGQVELQPDDEHQEDDAELGQVGHAGAVLRQRQRVRADQHADHEVAQHRRQLQRTAGHHAQHCGDEVEQRELEGAGHDFLECADASGAPGAMSAPPPFDAARALRLAARTFEIEARALQAVAARQAQGFAQAVQAMLECRGRVIVMGMGKSGHVGRKIAATLASTGTPAFFVHPAEASHGDLGMVQPGDVVLAISNSGESDELAAILPALRRIGVTLVAMTGQADSTLARHADLCCRAPSTRRPAR
jgi:D-arabinose 5-phosphate isomerase GutQ